MSLRRRLFEETSVHSKSASSVQRHAERTWCWAVTEEAEESEDKKRAVGDGGWCFGFVLTALQLQKETLKVPRAPARRWKLEGDVARLPSH